MDISIRKIRVLYQKDFLDMIKNISIVISALLPLFFAVLYKYLLGNLGILEDYLLSLILSMNLTMTAVMLPATSIAEEKEKHTLRTLMLSNVSGFEFCMSKMLATGTFMLITNILIYVIVGMDWIYLPAFTAAAAVGAVPLIVLGAAVGLAARDQMTAGVYEVPLMLLFLLPSIFFGMNPVTEVIGKITPCSAVVQLISQITGGTWLSKDTLFYSLVILIWIILSIGIFVLLFRKKGVDN